MRLLAYTKQRLAAFIAEIDHLGDSDFAYAHSRAALDELRRFFAQKLADLEALDPSTDPAIVKQHCTQALRSFFEFLPLLGFILRSTNVRNAFEMFRPLLHVAEQVVEPNQQNRSTKLLLSSEWEYSPLTFTRIPHLPGFVFLGFPAPESGNPLLLPLAGHELGHTVWAARDLGTLLIPTVAQNVVDVVTSRWGDFSRLFSPTYPAAELTTRMDAIAIWQVAAQWCVAQAEETFCDFLGFTLFGESFLHAFSYLLAPALGARRVDYPKIRERALRLEQLSQTKGATPPAGYTDLFDDDLTPGLTPEQLFLLEVADEAVSLLVGELTNLAEQVVADAGIPAATDAEKRRILDRFRLMVPAEQCQSLGDLLNAAWHASLDDTFWEKSSIPTSRRQPILKDLVLKNLEVMEIERIQANG